MLAEQIYISIMDMDKADYEENDNYMESLEYIQNIIDILKKEPHKLYQMCDELNKVNRGKFTEDEIFTYYDQLYYSMVSPNANEQKDFVDFITEYYHCMGEV